MKKITFLAFAMSFSLGAFSQDVFKEWIASPVQSLEEKVLKAEGDQSFLYPSSFDLDKGGCNSTSETYFWSYADGGDTNFIAGSNAYQPRAFAQRYQLSSPVKIVGISTWVSKKRAGDKGMVKISLYNASKDGIGIEMGADYQSPEKSTHELIVKSPNVLRHYFTTPVTMKDFAVAVTVPAWVQGSSSDICVQSTRKSCSNGRSYVYLPIIGNPTNYGWHTFPEYLKRTNIVDEHIDFFLLPIVESEYDMYEGTVGLNSIDVNNLSYVFPNPAQDEITIASSLSIKKVEIINMIGQKVLEQNVNNVTSNINVSAFASGNYIVRMFTDSGVANKKIIVK